MIGIWLIMRNYRSNNRYNRRYNRKNSPFPFWVFIFLIFMIYGRVSFTLLGLIVVIIILKYAYSGSKTRYDPPDQPPYTPINQTSYVVPINNENRKAYTMQSNNSDYCTACGTKVERYSKFCSSCGTKIAS